MTPSHRFSVAPMMDCTDRHFRVMARQISRRALLYTEMVVARALHHIIRDIPASRQGERKRRLEKLIGFDPIERPLALQLGGDDPELLAEATRLAADWGYDEVNLNVGCPSEKVRQGRFGACLMAEPDQVARCIAAMASAASLPVTIKHRIGIDGHDSYGELLHFVDAVADAGAQRFAVHARKAWLEGLDPRQNRTVPPLRRDVVHRLKRERPSLLIELNGGLQSLSDCLEELRPRDGVALDGVMVGRAAYGHPMRWTWVDGEVFNDPQAEQPRASGVIWAMVPHAERWCGAGGRLWPIARHLVHLVEGVKGARRWRGQLTHAGCTQGAGPEVLDQAAHQLRECGY
jgi:tRNA-dihydrouridine synthase A